MCITSRVAKQAKPWGFYQKSLIPSNNEAFTNAVGVDGKESMVLFWGQGSQWHVVLIPNPLGRWWITSGGQALLFFHVFFYWFGTLPGCECQGTTMLLTSGWNGGFPNIARYPSHNFLFINMIHHDIPSHIPSPSQYPLHSIAMFASYPPWVPPSPGRFRVAVSEAPHAPESAAEPRLPLLPDRARAEGAAGCGALGGPAAATLRWGSLERLVKFGSLEVWKFGEIPIGRVNPLKSTLKSIEINYEVPGDFSGLTIPMGFSHGFYMDFTWWKHDGSMGIESWLLAYCWLSWGTSVS